MLTKNPDPNATYYIQFTEASKSLEIGTSPSGDPVEVETTIKIVLLGLPQSEDLAFNFNIDPATTLETNMYQLGSNSLVIPAGKTSASTTLASISENMPVGEVVSLILNLDAGEHSATAGIILTYDFLLPAPCQPVPGIYTIEMIDTFGDGWQTNGGNGGNGITVDIDGVIIEVGMCSPYEALPYDGCVEGPSAATTYVEIPEGTQSAKWYFPGDWWGEIAFEIFDPNGISVYKVNGGEGVEGELPFEVCLD